jgi:hypothetical protein
VRMPKAKRCNLFQKDELNTMVTLEQHKKLELLLKKIIINEIPGQTLSDRESIIVKTNLSETH